MSEDIATGARQVRQQDRQRLISEAVATDGVVRIDQLAERFGISLMTVHRDLDQLQARGILRKARGIATAASTSLVESSDLYRFPRQQAEKEAIAQAALAHIEPGQAIFLDDSTTVLRVARLIEQRAPVTVITNVLTIMNELRDVEDLDLIALGGDFYGWCNAFMGRLTIESISLLRADLLLMSTSAIVDGVGYHQSVLTVDTKRAMFDAAARRILLVDHTKFGRRALHRLLPLDAFDLVIVDDGAPADLVDDLRTRGVEVEVAAVDPAVEG
jgi:DeoR/GlpR family transcriptional regulator of sugar metabolism